jgi:hypothetical protein
MMAFKQTITKYFVDNNSFINTKVRDSKKMHKRPISGKPSRSAVGAVETF